MFQVIDKFGNHKTLAWLYDQFGPVAVEAPAQPAPPRGLRPSAAAPAGPPGRAGQARYTVTQLRENDDLGPEAAQVKLKLLRGIDACSSIFVRVLDKDGNPVVGALVAFSWPDAPPAPGSGWTEKCVSGYTKDDGFASFAMGGGAYYFPPNRGPHQVWIWGPGTSEIVRGLGMIGGTNHRHLDVVFQEAGGTPPPPPDDPDVAAARAEIHAALLEMDASITHLEAALDHLRDARKPATK